MSLYKTSSKKNRIILKPSLHLEVETKNLRDEVFHAGPGEKEVENY